MMEISHPRHGHPLFLNDEVKFGGKCSTSRKEFDGDHFYACVNCKYYVHKSCAELPVEIQHPFHPPHPLTLCVGDSFACDSCHKSFRKELRFRCSTCDFDRDVKCATMSDINAEGKEFIRHFSHQHPLTICSNYSDNPLTCFACKKTSSDLFYGCTPCDYFLHKSCSEISLHVLHAIHPHHSLCLQLKYGSCYYCNSDDYTLKYYCDSCTFIADASCLLKSTKDVENSCFLCGKQHSDSDSCVDSLYFVNQSCIQLPKEIGHEFHSHKLLLLLGAKDFGCNSCHKWFDAQWHYSCEDCNFRMDVKCALMSSIQYEESHESIWPVIPPHFDHQHPLVLISEVDDINCSACHAIKVSPIYGCVKCEYFLHQSCLELPIQISHPLHDSHVLTIQPFHDSFCHICCRKYDGFGFGCIQCLFFIGIECIFELLPIKTLVRKYHCHPLYLIEKSYCDLCSADNTFCRFLEESSEFKLTKSYSLRCIKCDYNLHILCGPLPCTIKHKIHLHFLTLVDSIVEDDSDEYYCDVCEEIRNPRLCVYYCEDCQFFAHVHCVISEIINAFKKNYENVELRMVGNLRLEDSIDPSYNNLSEEMLLDLLNHLDANDIIWFRDSFPVGKLFLREEDPWETLKQESSTEDEDDTWNVIEELSFYNDNVGVNFNRRLKLFKPDIKYHIQLHELKLPVIEVEGYKVTSNFATLSRALFMRYGDFCHESELSKHGKSILLYLLCRMVSNMRRTYIDDITEKQLLTWICYHRLICLTAQLGFLEPFLGRAARSYLGLRAMKFEDEVVGRLDREIVKVEKEISEMETKKEELRLYRQQYRPGKIVAESKVMKEFVTEAKLQKHKTVGEGIV